MIPPGIAPESDFAICAHVRGLAKFGNSAIKNQRFWGQEKTQCQLAASAPEFAA
jgi:hypothetical protein